MPDKKLTDSEIVKALEWCEQFTDNLVTANIDTKKRTLGLQAMQTCKSALDLINRLQAENKNCYKFIEQLKEARNLWEDKCKELQAENEQKDKNYIELLKTSSERAVIIGEQGAEIERLKELVRLNPHDFTNTRKKEIKAEAYKECIEKAKENIKNLEYSAKTPRKTVKVEELEEQMDWVLHTVIIETLDNLLKEKVGE